MFYIFQLGTDMLTFTSLYFIELLFLFVSRGIGVDLPQTERLFLYSFPILLIVSFVATIINKSIKYHRMKISNIFHPSTTFRQRFAKKMFFVLILSSIVSFFVSFFFPNTERTIFIVFNSFSIFAITLSFIFSLLFEPIPDKNDTIRFEDTKMYYYMRVKKDIKTNKNMNSYIIPYDAITRSYIQKNTLFIEYSRNHPELQIHREFSTGSKRIVIYFDEYPELKKYIKNKNIANKIKLKNIKYIELADLQ